MTPYGDSTWVKLTLKPGQELTRYRRGPTDEGWASEEQTWRHCGDHITYVSVSDGRDCDGRLTRTYVSSCSIWELMDGRNDYWPAGINPPNWQKVEASQYDEYAEAMGY